MLSFSFVFFHNAFIMFLSIQVVHVSIFHGAIFFQSIILLICFVKFPNVFTRDVLPFLLHLSFWDSYYAYVAIVDVASHDPKALLISLWSFFSLFFRIDNVYRSIFKLLDCFVTLNLPLSPYSEIFISIIVLSNNRISIWFFL